MVLLRQGQRWTLRNSYSRLPEGISKASYCVRLIGQSRRVKPGGCSSGVDSVRWRCSGDKKKNYTLSAWWKSRGSQYRAILILQSAPSIISRDLCPVYAPRVCSDITSLELMFRVSPDAKEWVLHVHKDWWLPGPCLSNFGSKQKERKNVKVQHFKAKSLSGMFMGGIQSSSQATRRACKRHISVYFRYYARNMLTTTLLLPGEGGNGNCIRRGA